MYRCYFKKHIGPPKVFFFFPFLWPPLWKVCPSLVQTNTFPECSFQVQKRSFYSKITKMYIDDEHIVMVQIVGEAGGNLFAARRLYQKLSPTSFSSASYLPAYICETGDARNSMAMRVPKVRPVVDGRQEGVLALFREKPHMNIRQAVGELGLGTTSIQQHPDFNSEVL